MSEADRIKWDEHFRLRQAAALAEPNPLLTEWLPRLDIDSPSPLAVDVACGAGRHAVFLARRGWRVEAMDISQVALQGLAATARAQALPITCLQRDFEPAVAATPGAFFEPGRYDLAVMIRYTNLPLIGPLAAGMRAGGYLITEAYLASASADGGPRNPAYRVIAGELEATVAREFDIVHLGEAVARARDGRLAPVVQVVARRPG